MNANSRPAADQAKQDAQTPSSLGRWLISIALVAVIGLLSAFFAINEYAAGTAALVKNAQQNSARFETIYRDSAETQIRSLQLGVSLLLENADITNAFIKDDREALKAKVLPYYKEILKPRFNIDQYIFWTPPAKLYLRSSDPKSFAVDGSSFRQTVVASHEKRAEVSGMETGLGGVIGLRAMAPILDGTRLVGVVELGTEITNLLHRASTTTGLDYAVGLDQKRSDTVQRPSNPAVDAVQGTDIFYIYSNDQALKLVRSISFNTRIFTPQLIESGPKTYFVRSFSLNNYSGVPTVVIATVLDLTAGFAEVWKTVAIKTAILFLLASVTCVVAFTKFQSIQAGLKRSISGQRAELEERAAFCEAAAARLKDVDLIKRGFFTNLVTALNEPLQAVTGTLQTVVQRVTAGNVDQADIATRLRFALDETTRLSRLIGDYQQIELFRQKLVKSDSPLTMVATVVSRALEEDLAIYQRLPQLKIAVAIAPNLPPVRADVDLLRRAVAGLVAYAARGAGQGKINITGEIDALGWLKFSFTGSAFALAGAPTEALLDESRQFLTRLAADNNGSDVSGILVPIVLARIIIEFYGGSLEASPDDKAHPGFVMRLPVAV